MYPVSEAFLSAMQENTRRYYWTGKMHWWCIVLSFELLDMKEQEVLS
ncbi:hypothetical protein LI221_00740 [Faecalimonas umbilicata]|nr:hypothetical protein [Faecalimonas umbilicata]